MELLAENVTQLLRETAVEFVLPRFRSASAGATEKSPGDWVTLADYEAEASLSAALPLLLPGSCVVGEEAVHANPETMERLDGEDPVWLVDPVDGTANFAAGREPFAMIVALVEQGTTTHGWIHLPLEGRTLTTTRGAGAHINGTVVPASSPNGLMRGMVPLWALPPATADAIARRSMGVAELRPSWRCAGREYPDVLTGDVDFALFTGSRPWDHAAGALALTEAGGVAAYSDGTPYAPRVSERLPLLVARSPEIWDRVRTEILPPDAFRDAR